MKTVGVLGGMGPAATADFFTRVVRVTPAETEQDHLHLIIDNNPGIPNRNMAIAGTGPSPGPMLVHMACRLEQAGADFLVMPCNTAHAFADDIRAATQIPFISMIDETVAQIVQAGSARHIGLLAADGCLAAGLYQRALAAQGRNAVLLDTIDQHRFMALLYRIKSGDIGTQVRWEMRDLAKVLAGMGAEIIVAACTEVPLVLDGMSFDLPLIVSTDVLVASTIEQATSSSVREDRQ